VTIDMTYAANAYAGVWYVYIVLDKSVEPTTADIILTPLYPVLENFNRNRYICLGIIESDGTIWKINKIIHEGDIDDCFIIPDGFAEAVTSPVLSLNFARYSESSETLLQDYNASARLTSGDFLNTDKIIPIFEKGSTQTIKNYFYIDTHGWNAGHDLCGMSLEISNHYLQLHNFDREAADRSIDDMDEFKPTTGSPRDNPQVLIREDFELKYVTLCILKI
jgi:hypothetical protein